ncbi:DUF6706 family protein [Pedobacter nototheniae]|uniref:DUF6706 family protein n=1 Tax=Pedobacter nototheniae TaxID=2488994 RepID=UPI00103BD0BF|nr:DUF6706 family protein [Pedobacter nototheniae]
MEDEELEAVLVDQEITPEMEYTPALANKIKKALISIIPELLLAPDISQGDYSIKYKVDGIKAYYSMLCKEAGEQDVFNPSKDIIVDKSALW